MGAINIHLDKVLAERGLTRYQLAEAAKEHAFLGSSTVYAIVRGQFLPRLDTLAILMVLIEKLSGKPVELSEVLAYDRDAPTPPPSKPFSVAGRRKQDKE